MILAVLSIDNMDTDNAWEENILIASWQAPSSKGVARFIKVRG